MAAMDRCRRRPGELQFTESPVGALHLAELLPGAVHQRFLVGLDGAHAGGCGGAITRVDVQAAQPPGRLGVAVDGVALGRPTPVQRGAERRDAPRIAGPSVGSGIDGALERRGDGLADRVGDRLAFLLDRAQSTFQADDRAGRVGTQFGQPRTGGAEVHRPPTDGGGYRSRLQPLDERLEVTDRAGGELPVVVHREAELGRCVIARVPRRRDAGLGTDRFAEPGGDSGVECRNKTGVVRRQRVEAAGAQQAGERQPFVASQGLLRRRSFGGDGLGVDPRPRLGQVGQLAPLGSPAG